MKWVNNSGKTNRNKLREEWIPKHFAEDDGDSYQGDADYCGEQDNYYWPEGWYEWNFYEETHWVVEGKVTHWMCLPDFPEDS
jgi:hypothetical protein